MPHLITPSEITCVCGADQFDHLTAPPHSQNSTCSLAHPYQRKPFSSTHKPEPLELSHLLIL